MREKHKIRQKKSRCVVVVGGVVLFFVLTSSRSCKMKGMWKNWWMLSRISFSDFVSILVVYFIIFFVFVECAKSNVNMATVLANRQMTQWKSLENLHKHTRTHTPWIETIISVVVQFELLLLLYLTLIVFSSHQITSNWIVLMTWKLPTMAFSTWTICKYQMAKWSRLRCISVSLWRKNI